jgi:hypothetical protein
VTEEKEGLPIRGFVFAVPLGMALWAVLMGLGWVVFR